MARKQPLGLGMIGCGAFGAFCIDAFSRLDDVRLVAVADIRKDVAESFGREFGVPAYGDPAELLGRDDVDIVHVATPPASHAELVLAAIKAGKHTLCEKPLATDCRHAKKMLAAADKVRRIVPVHFVLRHNLVADAVKAVIDSGVLGRVLAGRLTNCATDTPLGPSHWFWDRTVSGGIFIEHGTHFFDLYRHWLGGGEVIDAHTEMREGTDQQDRVMCTVRHDSGAVVSHYHGFDQVLMMDRTSHRLVCELGDIRVDGWIPLSLQIDAAIDEPGVSLLGGKLCPGCELQTVETFDEQHRSVSGRGRQRKLTRRVRLTYQPNADKRAVYADSIRSLLADQIAFIRDPSHERRVVERNGYDSLAMAVRAVELAGG